MTPQPKPWKYLSRKIILTHPRLEIAEDRIELPNGKITEYVRIMPGCPHSVIVIALSEQQEILLQKEYSYPPDEVMWQLPGGGMKSGESAATAAVRELAEESGFKAQRCTIVGYYYVDNRRNDAKQYVAICEDLQPGVPKPEAEEFIQNQWVSSDKLQQLILAGDIKNIFMLAALQLWVTKKINQHS